MNDSLFEIELISLWISKRIVLRPALINSAGNSHFSHNGRKCCKAKIGYLNAIKSSPATSHVRGHSSLMETERVSEILDIDSEFMQLVAGEDVVTVIQKTSEYCNKCNIVIKLCFNEKKCKIVYQGQNWMPFDMNVVQRFGLRPYL